MDTITVNGHELSIDLLEADSLEKFENAMTETSRKVDEMSANPALSHADQYRFQCKCVDEFFDTVFGPGTAEMIFGPNNTNIKDHVDAFGKAALMPSQSGTDIRQIMEDYTEQANNINAASMNRAQRRAQEKRDRKAARNLKLVQDQKQDQQEQDEEQEENVVAESPAKEVDDTQAQLDEFVSGLTDEQRKKLAGMLTSDNA